MFHAGSLAPVMFPAFACGRFVVQPMLRRFDRLGLADHFARLHGRALNHKQQGPLTR